MKKLAIALLCMFPLLAAAESQVSALLVDLTHPQVLAQENPEQQLAPASVSKLFVASAALRHFGAYHQFTTSLYYRGNIRNGILYGDLILYGQGDPVFTNEKMWSLANQLRALGIKRVKGDLVVSNAYFGTVDYADGDRMHALLSSAVGYDGLVSSSASNFGTVGLTIYPAPSEGQAALISVVPVNLPNIFVKGKVITSDLNPSPLQVVRSTVGDDEYIEVSGTVALHAAPITVYRSVGRANLATGGVLKSFLKQAGISLSGNTRTELTPLQPTDQLLLAQPSTLLSQIVWKMLFYSNNFIADMLTLDLWRAERSAGLPSINVSAASSVLVADYLTMTANSTIAKTGNSIPVLNSGSGITASSKVSALEVVRLLDAMYRDTRNFPSLYGALTVPAATTHWRDLDTSQYPWMSRVSVKTGSLNNPLAVRSIAGYVRLNNGDLGAFALLINQPGGENIDKLQLDHELADKLTEILNSH